MCSDQERHLHNLHTLVALTKQYIAQGREMVAIDQDKQMGFYSPEELSFASSDVVAGLSFSSYKEREFILYWLTENCVYQENYDQISDQEVDALLVKFQMYCYLGGVG